jgi:hypothetical protein
MIDIAAAAASAVTLITPALIEIGKGVAKKTGEAGGDSLVGWLRGKLTGSAAREALADLEAAPESPDLQAALRVQAAREALADLEAAPENQDLQAALRVQLVKLLTKEPALLAELHALLPAPGFGADSMTQHIEGAGAKGAQIKGDGNSVTIG